MKNRYALCLVTVAALLLFAGCALQVNNLKPDCAPHDLSADYAAGKYVKKADNVYFILDISGSMEQGACGTRKLAVAKLVLDMYNNTMPEGAFNAVLRTFGHGGLFSMQTDLIYGPAKHSRSEMGQALDTITYARSNTPLALSIAAANEDLKQVSGRTAMIIVSDFLADVDETIREVEKIKQAYGDNICIYPVVIGNEQCSHQLAMAIGHKSGCGFSRSAGAVTGCDDMKQFVKDTLLTCAGAPAPAAPTPAAPIAEKVVLRGVQFDFDDASIRTQSRPILDEGAVVLQKYADRQITIVGHTCSLGAAEYNQGLSERRARSVKKYLVEKGLDPQRLTVVGKGEMEPVASNDTLAGRKKNRRVEFLVGAE